MSQRQSRRAFLRVLLAAPAPLLLAACGGAATPEPTAAPAAAQPTIPRVAAPTASPAALGAAPTATAAPAAPTATAAPAAALPATPACDDEDEPTIAQTEGPFYTPS
ncbi:MAG TPA: hypothetical protein PKD53_20045, partial [Chloroflexaceae bacterium]|nr:hypothetical protein [Chloroflexaceae bacterium]